MVSFPVIQGYTLRSFLKQTETSGCSTDGKTIGFWHHWRMERKCVCIYNLLSVCAQSPFQDFFRRWSLLMSFSVKSPDQHSQYQPQTGFLVFAVARLNSTIHPASTSNAAQAVKNNNFNVLFWTCMLYLATQIVSQSSLVTLDYSAMIEIQWMENRKKMTLFHCDDVSLWGTYSQQFSDKLNVK